MKTIEYILNDIKPAKVTLDTMVKYGKRFGHRIKELRHKKYNTKYISKCINYGAVITFDNYNGSYWIHGSTGQLDIQDDESFDYNLCRKLAAMK